MRKQLDTFNSLFGIPTDALRSLAQWVHFQLPFRDSSDSSIHMWSDNSPHLSTPFSGFYRYGSSSLILPRSLFQLPFRDSERTGYRNISLKGDLSTPFSGFLANDVRCYSKAASNFQLPFRDSEGYTGYGVTIIH